MVDSRKQLANIASRAVSRQEEEVESLFSRKPDRRLVKGSSAKARFIFHSCLFMIGLVSVVTCLWAMLYTSDSEELAMNLGMQRVANSLDNILSLLAFPFLIFSIVLTLYSGQQLYRLYKEVNQVSSSRLSR